MQFNSIAIRNFFKSDQSGIIFDAQFVKLIKFIANSTIFRRLFLRP